MSRIVIILHLIACVFSEDFVHFNESNITNPVNNGGIIRIPLIKLEPVVEQNAINHDVHLNRTRRSLFSGRLFNDPFFGDFGNDKSLDLGDMFDDMMNGIETILPGLRLPFRISPFRSAGNSRYDSPLEQASSTKSTKSTNTNEIINQTPKVIDSTNGKEHNTVPKPNGNSIRLRNFNDTSYAGLMYIGYPNPQEFLMIFDTGSSDIWVPSSKCSRFNSACQKHKRYDSSKSKQYKRDNRKFHITYGTGEVSGFTSIDSVTIANLRIEDQVFGEATKQSGSTFTHAEFDGIFGMGFPSISVTDRKSPIDRMFSQGLIKRRMFCFILHHTDGKRAADGKLIGGEVQIGGCDVQPTMYIPLTQKTYWQFKMAAVLVSKNDGSVYRACRGGCQAIMDTGTSLITGPANEIRQINQMIGAKKNIYTGEYQIDCKRKNLPTIAFIIQGHRLDLTSDDYIIQVRKNLCLSGFMSMESTHGETQWIIGDVFMRTRVTVFDMDNNRIGLAPNKH